MNTPRSKSSGESERSTGAPAGAAPVKVPGLPAPVTVSPERAVAVAAAHPVIKPQPKANVAPEGALGGAVDLNDRPLSGASGFVGILARRQPGPGDSHMPVTTADIQARRARYALRMAKEVGKAPPAEVKAAEEPLPIPAPVVPQESPRMALRHARRAGKSPRTGFLPGVTVVLLGIGLWAAGAIMYMQAKAPSSPGDVHYPLIFGQPGEPGTYARHSVLMAWGALPCLPVALVMGGGLLWAWRRRP